MGNRPSNRLRNSWTIDLLSLNPEDNVLEIGHGPGIGLEGVVKKVTKGRIMGLDHSAAMGQQAARRNREAIDQGHVTLVQGSISDPSPPAGLTGPFDKIYGVNVAMFWDDAEAVSKPCAPCWPREAFWPSPISPGSARRPMRHPWPWPKALKRPWAGPGSPGSAPKSWTSSTRRRSAS